MDRAEGRNRSEIPDLDSRIQALDQELAAGNVSGREFLFNVEAYAWAILQRLRAELFERRLEMPKSDAEVFTILQRNDLLDLAEARKLRQFCEARTLASRDLRKVDLDGIREMAADRDWIGEILKRYVSSS